MADNQEDAPRGNTDIAQRSYRNFQHILPNMLVVSTNALNKSNSKRVTVGLEYHGGFYRPVVKLGDSGVPSRYLTLDTDSWEIIHDQVDTISAYFGNDYDFCQKFGRPTEIYLPNHDISFTTAYESKTINIEERPIMNITRPIDKEPEHDAQPPMKKRKIKNPPNIVMQAATFEGLKDLRECINIRIKHLEETVAFVNRTRDSIMEFFLFWPFGQKRNRTNKANPQRLYLF